VSGLDLGTETKTLYVDDVDASQDGVCLKDADIDFLSDISNACTGNNETLLTCAASGASKTFQGQTYICTDEGSELKIEGLRYSGVREDSCTESWTCSEWSTCSASSQSCAGTWTDASSCGPAYSGSNTRNCTSDADDDDGVPVTIIPTKSVVWSTVNAGETKTLTIDNSDIFADSIDVEFISDITNAKLTIKQVTAPANSKEGTVYAYLEITKENFENSDISSASIKFRVAKSWLDDNSISKEDIALFRYITQWNELETVIEREDDSNAYYTATTSGFSTFAIAPREVAPEVVEEVPEEPVPEEVPLVEEIVPPEEEEVPNILWLIAAIVVIVFIYIFWKEGKRLRGSKGNGKELKD